MYFYPDRVAKYYEIFEERRRKALEIATAFRAAAKIRMKVERFKPVHFALATSPAYTLPAAGAGALDVTKTLLANTSFIPFGMFNTDTTFDFIKWWRGKKILYIADWFLLDIAQWQDKEGVWAGQLNPYVFYGSDVFTFTTDKTAAGTSVTAWPIAWVVVPETLSESLITTS